MQKNNYEKRKIQSLLRLATVFGYSERMRLDLVGKYFANIKPLKRRKLKFEGKFKRNFIYIDDVVGMSLFIV